LLLNSSIWLMIILYLYLTAIFNVASFALLEIMILLRNCADFFKYQILTWLAFAEKFELTII